MFAKLLKIFATRCNIKTNIRSETPRLEGLHMSQDEHNKQKDITFLLLNYLIKNLRKKYGIFWCLSGAISESKF